MKVHEKAHLGFSSWKQTGLQVSGNPLIKVKQSGFYLWSKFFSCLLAKNWCFFWSETNFIPGIHLQYLVFLLCSCVPMTPFDSKHVFRHIYWLLFWLCSAVNSPACKAWSPCALCSLFSLLLKQMLWSISRFVSLFKHHGTSYLGLQRSTKEHLCIFFSQDEPECMKYFYQEKVPGWGSSTPGAARLCQRFVNRWGCTAMEHIYFNFQHHVLKYLIWLVIAI